MSTPTTPAPPRFTLRDLPLPAKLVVTTFLISVGMGYLWAMAQIHFKHASAGEPMPTQADLVARFSGVPWPLVPKPEGEKKDDALAKADAIGVKVPAVKIKTVLNSRCVWCHGGEGGEKDDKPLTNYDQIAVYFKPTPEFPKGQLHAVVTGTRKSWNSKNMVKAFFEKSLEWDDLKAEERAKSEPSREAERLAVVAWVEAGAPKAQYEADAFPLPADFKNADLPQVLKAVASPLAPAAVGAPKPPPDPWKEAKGKQLSVSALTQSTHAHLLTFSILWALTGLTFAFTRYPYVVRTLLAPIVLLAQVLDVWCWWLARLQPPAGPYFALAIMGTGTVVGIGLILQIVLSLWDLYGRTGRLILILLFVAAATGFGLAFDKVISPQLQAERAAANVNNGD
jgi:hypothetical protein